MSFIFNFTSNITLTTHCYVVLLSMYFQYLCLFLFPMLFFSEYIVCGIKYHLNYIPYVEFLLLVFFFLVWQSFCDCSHRNKYTSLVNRTIRKRGNSLCVGLSLCNQEMTPCSIFWHLLPTLTKANLNQLCYSMLLHVPVFCWLVSLDKIFIFSLPA